MHGAPPFLIQLIEDLHAGTTSRITVGGQLSEPFKTTSGVRQGCVLAPALFFIALTGFSPDVWMPLVSQWALSGSLIKNTPMTPRCSLIVRLRLAPHSFKLRRSRTYNRPEHILVENQDPELRPWDNSGPLQLQGHVVDSTDRFTYLGSDMHSSERSTPEILISVWPRTYSAG